MRERRQEEVSLLFRVEALKCTCHSDVERNGYGNVATVRQHCMYCLNIASPIVDVEAYWAKI